MTTEVPPAARGPCQIAMAESRRRGAPSRFSMFFKSDRAYKDVLMDLKEEIFAQEIRRQPQLTKENIENAMKNCVNLTAGDGQPPGRQLAEPFPPSSPSNSVMTRQDTRMSDTSGKGASRLFLAKWKLAQQFNRIRVRTRQVLHSKELQGEQSRFNRAGDHLNTLRPSKPCCPVDIHRLESGRKSEELSSHNRTTQPLLNVVHSVNSWTLNPPATAEKHHRRNEDCCGLQETLQRDVQPPVDLASSSSSANRTTSSHLSSPIIPPASSEDRKDDNTNVTRPEPPACEKTCSATSVLNHCGYTFAQGSPVSTEEIDTDVFRDCGRTHSDGMCSTDSLPAPQDKEEIRRETAEKMAQRRGQLRSSTSDSGILEDMLEELTRYDAKKRCALRRGLQRLGLELAPNGIASRQPCNVNALLDLDLPDIARPLGRGDVSHDCCCSCCRETRKREALGPPSPCATSAPQMQRPSPPREADGEQSQRTSNQSGPALDGTAPVTIAGFAESLGLSYTSNAAGHDSQVSQPSSSFQSSNLEVDDQPGAVTDHAVQASDIRGQILCPQGTALDYWGNVEGDNAG